ncbi:YheC/YheD family protein [Brevibacillus composti]|uniref:YheC/YheD family protein n=1 Tax=Brevibacillus composti TaxID=2796470 RepID=A0A7T5EJ21_9BACL|nr:YheC/YheD family protein [Brevibacillus composti]QQE73552.1 YheC/YheD family protein [Brevibacillus composti]QUO40634.1 YheC/YheD family protein [Brevibacillus composti]
MSYAPITLQSYEPKTDIDLYLPQAHMRKWNLTPTTLTVQFGGKTARAHIQGIKQGRYALIRPSMAKALHLPKGVPLLVRYQASQQRLVFGPYLGILVSTYLAQYPLSPFGGFTAFFNEVTDSCRKRGGIVCVFRMEDVDWDAGIVKGLVRRNGAWQPTVLPLPQCIYNRMVSRQRERSEAMAAWKERCKEANIPFFNEQFLNKWHVHSALENEPEAAKHLPRTIRYLGKADLETMLSSYKTIYAKPANGSMGRGIARIRRASSGYQLSLAGGSSTVYGSLGDLHRQLSRRTKGKTYLLQQGLPLIGINQRPTDFRVLVQKDRQGKWGVTSMVARLGQNRIVSNVSRGGSMTSPASALRMCGPWMTNIRPSVQTLRSVALKLAQLLEQSLSGHYAEFGIDLGVDVHGQVWLLEVNSKPSKTTNSLPGQGGDPETPRRVRPSVLQMLDYASYLSGFPRSPKQTAGTRKKPRRR